MSRHPCALALARAALTPVELLNSASMSAIKQPTAIQRGADIGASHYTTTVRSNRSSSATKSLSMSAKAVLALGAMFTPVGAKAFMEDQIPAIHVQTRIGMRWKGSEVVRDRPIEEKLQALLKGELKWSS
jgi:hypothetical protein